MNDEQDRITVRCLMTHIRSELRKKLNEGEYGWDPDEAYEVVRSTLERCVPEDSGFRVKTPSKEQLVALRLRGEDIYNTLRLDVEYTPPKPVDHISMKFTIGDKT